MRGKRYDPLIFPANSPKNSRNGIGCIQRNPKKGIESSILLHCLEFRHYHMLHSKKSPKRELRVLYTFFCYYLTPLPCCIQRNPKKGIERYNGRDRGGYNEIFRVTFKEIPKRELREVYWLCISYSVYFTHGFCCIQRNPTKGIEKGILVAWVLLFQKIALHSTKSHKGN